MRGRRVATSVQAIRISARLTSTPVVPVIACDTDAIRAGDEIEVDPVKGEARVGDETITFTPFPDGLWAMIEAGGLVPYLQAKGDF